MAALGGQGRRKPGAPGVTLVEVALATGVAAVFLTAFLVQYRVQQSSYQVASDELRLPPQGHATASRILGADGLMKCYQPPSVQPLGQVLEVRPDRVTLPTGSRMSTTTLRQIRFEEFAGDPRPAGSRAGRIYAADQTGAIVDLSPASLIATMSFYSPELIANATFPNTSTPLDSTSYARPGAVVVSGQPAFHLLGAAIKQPSEVGPNRVIQVTHAAGTSQWTFTAGALVRTKEFRAGEEFFLDFSALGLGTLACVWPLTQNANAVAGNLTYEIRPLTDVRRIGFWFQLNTSPFTGKIAMRDSAYLRY